MNKHAYMIIAHNQFENLQLLIDQIDDERNDIYIHIDNKVKKNINEIIQKKNYKSEINIFSNVEVFWGDVSQIEVELALFKEATKKYHSRYHLLSGTDLLIKPVDTIYDFFENNKNKEYIQYDACGAQCKDIEYRYRYYWFFMKNRDNLLLKALNSVFVNLQKIIRLERRRSFTKGYAKGPNWISVTHNCLNLIISNEKVILENFKNTLCCDEVFLHTVVYNSNLFKNVERQNYRFVVWGQEGDNSPLFLTMDYYSKLKNSNCFFARKFSVNIDKDIIDKIMKDLT